ncbi:MAG TPA: aminotransferase class IV [Polyangiales bacterium]|nr:aminotransferase class IV [Polyangiales bacterium]
MKVWIDGELLDGAHARIPISDHGLLYGDGIFEGMRATNGRIFKLDAHLARLSYGARALHLALPGGLPALRSVAEQTLAAFGDPDAYVRLIVTRGDGALGVDPTTCPRPRVICLADRIALFSDEKRRAGLALITSSWRRPASDALDPRIKSLNYLNNVLAKGEAKRQGADDALLLNAQGGVAEASVANVFVVQRGALLTPPTTDGCLDGITRASVLECARALGIVCGERTLGRMDLFAADEVFLTGTGAGMVRVASLDGESIGEPDQHPISDRLMAAYERMRQAPSAPSVGA